MRHSMWTYPWDVKDLGLETTIADLRSAGLSGISLATSYHAGRFLRPRGSTTKVYFPEDGTIYFDPDPAIWKRSRMSPQVSTVVGRGDVLRQLVDARETSGLAVHAWTVCLHNTRLGLQHPECCTMTAFGDVNTFSLCPSNDDARAYARALVADITHNYRVDSVELETPSFMPYAHGFHHEKDGVGLTPEDDFLLSLCFCPSCLYRAKEAGVDGEAARTVVLALVTESLERDRPAPRYPEFSPEKLAWIPELAAYIRWRSEPVTSLIAELREAAHPESRVYLVDGVDGWVCGCDHAEIAKACDGLILCTYDMSAEKAGASAARGRAVAGDKYLGAGFRVFYPEMQDVEALRQHVRAALTGGADGVNFYCYGLIPKARLDWVRQALAART